MTLLGLAGVFVGVQRATLNGLLLLEIKVSGFQRGKNKRHILKDCSPGYNVMFERWSGLETRLSRGYKETQGR